MVASSFNCPKMPISTIRAKIGTATGHFKERKVVVSEDDFGLEIAIGRSFLPHRTTHRIVPSTLIQLQIRWIALETQLV
jgi:hypothetical protein